MEQWKPIPGYRGYWASDRGRIKTWDKILIPRLNKKKWGYPEVEVWTGGILVCEHCYRRKGSKSVRRKVHRLVMGAFHGDCPEGLQVGHLDGNPMNNNLANLKYVTIKENAEHRIQHGTNNQGSRQWKAKLTEDQVRLIRALAPTISKFKIAKQFSITESNVIAILKRKTWKHVD